MTPKEIKAAVKKYHINPKVRVKSILHTYISGLDLIEEIKSFLSVHQVEGGGTIEVMDGYDGDRDLQISAEVNKTEKELLKEIKEAEKNDKKQLEWDKKEYIRLKKLFEEEGETK